MISPRKKFLAISIFSAIFSLTLVFLIVFPFFNKIRVLSGEVSAAKKSLAAAEIKGRDLLAWGKEYPLLEPKIKTVRALLTNADTPIEFLRFLEDLARQTDVAMELSFSSDGAKVVAGSKTLFFNLALTSSFPDSLRFMEKLENAPYLVEVQNFGFARVSEKDVIVGKYKADIGEAKLNLSIKIEADGGN